MKCARIAKELSAYLDGEVTLSARVEIEAHLGSCPACQQRLAELRKLATGVAAQPQAQPSPRFLSEVRAKISGAEPAAEKSRWFDVVFHPVWLKVPLEAVAVVVLLFTAGMLLLPSRPQPAERVSGALTKNAEQPAQKEVPVAASRNELEPATTRSAPPLGPVVTAAPMRKDALVALGDRDQPKAAVAPVEDRERPASAGAKPASGVPTAVVRGFSGQVQQVAKSGSEVQSETTAQAVQQVTATMEVAAVSVADVQQRAETFAAALGGRLLVASGNAREKSDEFSMSYKSKAIAAPAVLVELPTSQVAAFKERLLAGTKMGIDEQIVRRDIKAEAKDQSLVMDKLSESTTSSARSSVALGAVRPRAPQPQQTQDGRLRYGTVPGGVVAQQHVADLSASQQVETVGQALPTQEETTARTVLEIRVILPAEAR
jgi:hypothetical protein